MEQPASREYERAKWWRVNVLHMSVQELATATGYTIEAVYLMERGINSSGRKVKPWCWQRYKMACAGVAFARRSGEWNWEQQKG